MDGMWRVDLWSLVVRKRVQIKVLCHRSYATRSYSVFSSLQCVTYTEVSDIQTVVDRPAPQLLPRSVHLGL